MSVLCWILCDEYEETFFRRKNVVQKGREGLGLYRPVRECSILHKERFGMKQKGRS